MIKYLLALGGKQVRHNTLCLLGLGILCAIAQGVSLWTLIPITENLYNNDFSQAYTWLLMLIIGAVISGILLTVATLYGFSTSMNIISVLHKKLGETLINLPLHWFRQARIGTASHIAVQGTMTVAQSAMDFLIPIIINTVMPLTVAILCLIYQWQLGLLLCINAIVLWFFTRIALKRNHQAEENIHTASELCNTRLIEFTQHQITLRAYGNTISYPPLQASIQQLRYSSRKALWSSIIGMTTQSFVVQIMFSLTIAYSIWLSHGINPAHTIALLVICTQFISPLKIIAELATSSRKSTIELAEIHSLIHEPCLSEPKNPQHASAPYEIRFDKVNFSYNSADNLVLDNINCTIPANSICALVGPSGSGKSTIAKLIARFWDPHQGEIYINGVDIKNIPISELMNMISMIFQDVYLFNDTIEANILIGKPTASTVELSYAMQEAGVDEIIQRLGADTIVGEGGANLSGGEKQRISVARALLKKAPIVICDEATSALDSITEKVINNALSKLSDNATVIIIAHKLHTICRANNIIFLENGKICESDTHDNLLSLQGRYAQFWEILQKSHNWLNNKAIVTDHRESKQNYEH